MATRSASRQGLPRHRLRHSQPGGAGRQRRLGPVSGAGGLVSRRRARGDGRHGPHDQGHERQAGHRRHRRHQVGRHRQVHRRLHPGCARHRPEAEVKVAYSNNFGDPAIGLQMAKAMFDEGADIVYQVAGGTGLGVIQAAKETGHFAIGVDTDQDGLAPGHVLTSMIKRTDVAVETVMQGLRRRQVPRRPDGDARARAGRRRPLADEVHEGPDPRRDPRQGRGSRKAKILSGEDQGLERRRAGLSGLLQVTEARTRFASARRRRHARAFGDAVVANDRIDLSVAPRHDPRGRRRQRGRQVDADAHPAGRRPSRRGNRDPRRSKPVALDGPADAFARGIGMVHQEFMLAPPLTLLENLILGARAGARSAA